MALKQFRDAIKQKILDCPESITITRYQTKDNGFGVLVQDYTKTPESLGPYNVRISHEQSGPDKMVESPNGLSTNLQRFILSEYSVVISENDTFTALGKKYKIGPVDPLKKFGGIAGYQAPLIDAGDA